MYEAVTHQVKVTVEPTFDPERSDPDERRYFWRYAVEIVNLGDKSVTLIERYWRITDDAGMLELLAPYAGHRYRVTRLIELGGSRPPRRGPRMPVRDYRAF